MDWGTLIVIAVLGVWFLESSKRSAARIKRIEERLDALQSPGEK